MIAIKEIMKRDFHKLSFLDSVESAVKTMEKTKSDYLLIEEKNKIKGVVTSCEIAGYPSSRLILDCAIKPIAAISEKTLLDEALKILKEKKVDFLVVINKQGTPVGAANQEIIISFLYQELKKSNIKKEKYIVGLKKAEESLKEFSRGLEEKVKERTFALSILYEISNALAYTLDYQQLMKLIMESLFKIVDCDICGSLLFDARTATVILKPAYAESAQFADKVKNNLIDSTSTITGENLHKKQASVFIIPLSSEVKPKGKRNLDELRSFFNVPFIVCNRTIGMINVSSCEESAFSEEDIKIIYTIANQASNAIEKLQAVITAEKSKMASMVESMAEGVIMIDERGEIAVLNPQARQMLGFGLEQEVTSGALNKKIKALTLDKALEESNGMGRLVTKEIAVSQGKENIILRSDVTPVRDAEGGIIGIVTILRDITKEKKIDMMKTEFISTVSHELRTPLTTMKQFTSIILDEIPGKLTNDQREYVDIIKDNIDRLARLINNLLDISKIEAGRVELKKMLVDVTDLAKATISALKPEADGKYIEINALFSAIAINVYVDPDKITQVFTNLISNAIKFTPEKGKITVEIKDGEKEVECSVTDTGKGIAPDDLGKLFARFQQFGRVAGDGAKGTGLGLAISKELVEAHNGRIWAESKIDEGSKFIFTLLKHTTKSLFEEYIDNGIKEAVKNGYRMSIIMASLLEFDKLKQRFPGQKSDFILKNIERVLKYSLREGDMIVREAGEIIIFLEDCNKENALRVESRFEEEMNDYLSREKLDEEIKLRFGCATYPDEAKDADELLEKARTS